MSDYNSRFNKAELTNDEIAVLTNDEVIEYSHIQCQKLLEQLPSPKETD